MTAYHACPCRCICHSQYLDKVLRCCKQTKVEGRKCADCRGICRIEDRAPRSEVTA